jgi:hypothetical protein
MSEDNKEVALPIEIGLIHESLARTSKQIREERGADISEALEMDYKRKIEDYESDLKRMTRTQRNMFDFSPTMTTSLVIAKDVDSKEILDKDLAAALDIHNIRIKLRIAQQRYNDLFGETYKIAK